MDEGSVYSLLLILFIILLTLSASNAGAENEDTVFFSGGYNGDAYEETHIAYVGEESLLLLVEFGNNCTNWSVEFSNPLFGYEFTGYNVFSGSKGIAGGGSLLDVPFASDVTPGIYHVILYLNYTAENGSTVNRIYNPDIQYKKMFEIIKKIIPERFERTLGVEIQTNCYIHQLKVMFDSDGDIEVENDEYKAYDVQSGTYTYKTKIRKGESFRDDAQEVAYHVIGTVGGRTVEIYEYNIRVSVTWGPQDYILTTPGAICCAGALLPIISVIFIYLKGKSNRFKPNDGRIEGQGKDHTQLTEAPLLQPPKQPPP